MKIPLGMHRVWSTAQGEETAERSLNKAAELSIYLDWL